MLILLVILTLGAIVAFLSLLLAYFMEKHRGH